MFKKDQRVYCLARGWGTVLAVSEGGTYQVQVGFDTGVKDSYTIEGKRNSVDSLRTLFFAPPPEPSQEMLTPPPEPRNPYEYGLLVQLKSGTWIAVHRVLARSAGNVVQYDVSDLTGAVAVVQPTKE